MNNTTATKTHEQILAHEPWYHGLLPREEMKVLLTQKGDFLLRFTDPKVGEPRKFVLSIFVGTSEDIRHYVIREVDNKFAVDQKWFNSIADLLNYYHRTKEPVATGCFESVLIRPIGREPWEKQHSDVTLIKKLGEGAFGEVQLGEIRIGNTVKKAAIKLAKLEALTKEQIKEIMHEARLMRKFKHPNVVTFYGVAAGQEPLMVIMELAENGALDSYLKKNIGNLPLSQKNDMILQAARGLEYLHSMQVIHRDIASRNCLYGNGQVKISDFGLSREGSTYRLNPRKKVPIRWLAPEVPRTGYYTPKSDVFAYGIMCWEVYNDGAEPYPGMTVAEVLPKVQDGYRMQLPDEVPFLVAQYIREKVCAGNDSDRVSMADVIRDLPAIDGFDCAIKSDGYFTIPGGSASNSEPQAVRTSSVHNILPYMSQPTPAPNAALTPPPNNSQQPSGQQQQHTDTPKKSISTSEESAYKKNRKPAPIKSLWQKTTNMSKMRNTSPNLRGFRQKRSKSQSFEAGKKSQVQPPSDQNNNNNNNNNATRFGRPKAK